MAETAGPTFLGIGAQKAGTTWLHKMLRLHPDIGMPEQKELHFWDREEPDAAAVERYRQVFAALGGRANGEITPSYAILPPEKIALIQRHLPELRLIYVLRNPIDRAWSHARMMLGWEAKKGHPPPADLDAWLEEQLRSSASLDRGDYAACLERWRHHYTGDQLKVFIYEQAFTTPRRFLEECCVHLGVDPGYYASVSDEYLLTPVLPEKEILGTARAPFPEKPPARWASTLKGLYAESIERTGKLIGRDLAALWL